METIAVCENKALGASESFTGAPVDMSGMEGYASVQAKISGNGTAKITYQVSHDGHAWATPEGAPDVLTGITKTSGPESNGIVAAQFNPVLAPWMRLVITETGGASAVLATVALTIK